MKDLESLIEKYADDPNDFRKKLQPWLQGSLRVLDVTIPTLTSSIVSDKNHVYNQYDQWGGDIKSTALALRGKVAKMLSNINTLSVSRLYKYLQEVKGIISANPMYKVNPFFKLKINTTYSFQQCVSSIDGILLKALQNQKSANTQAVS